MKELTEIEKKELIEFYKKKASAYISDVIKQPDEYFMSELAVLLGIKLDNYFRNFVSRTVLEGGFTKRKVISGQYKNRTVYKIIKKL